MKRRITYFAAVVVLADLLTLGAVWHVSPTLSLTVGLAVPEVEQILSPLYPDPVREDVASGELHRPARPRSTVVLTGDASRPGGNLRGVARALARRDIAVLVPGPSAALEATVAHARTLGVPVRVESVTAFELGGPTPQDPQTAVEHGGPMPQDPQTPFDDADGRSTIATRAAYAWRLLRLSHGLLTAR